MSTNKKYRHITKTERLEIAILLEKNYSYREIAKAMGRHHTNISREIKKNSANGIYTLFDDNLEPLTFRRFLQILYRLRQKILELEHTNNLEALH